MLDLSKLKILWTWVRHQNRMFWRTPIAAFFVFGLPVFMMALLSSLFSGNLDCFETDVQGVYNCVSFPEFYIPAMAAFSVASATYTNLATSLTIYREERILKRVRGTPLSPTLYLLSGAISAVWIALLSSTIMFLVGVLAFDAQVRFGQLGITAIFFVLGVVVFSFLGMAISTFIPSGRAAPAVTSSTILPLAFISEVFIYLESAPRWLEVLGDIFPLKSLSRGFRLSLDSSLDGELLVPLLTLAAWGLVGVLVVFRRFYWLPISEAKNKKIPSRVE